MRRKEFAIKSKDDLKPIPPDEDVPLQRRLDTGFLPIYNEDEKQILRAGLEQLRVYYQDSINKNPDMALRPLQHARERNARELMFRIDRVKPNGELGWSSADD